MGDAVKNISGSDAVTFRVNQWQVSSTEGRMAGERVSPLEAQVREAIAILRDGTDYERLHVVGILEDGLAAGAGEREAERTGLIDAAYDWWVSKRPRDYTEADHHNNPTVNTVTMREKALAEAVSRLAASPAAPATPPDGGTKP